MRDEEEILSFRLKTKNKLSPLEDWEFPVRSPKDINEIVIVHKFPYAFYYAEEIIEIAKKDDVAIPTKLLFLGRLSYPYQDYFFRDNFLFRFGTLINETHPSEANAHHPGPYKEAICLIKFKTLLAGYQLFKKDFKQFKKLLKTAKDEEEFCILAGLS